MKIKIAINGFGRIGRSAFKIAIDRPDTEIVAINDLTDAGTLAHLLEYDSNYGRYGKAVKSGERSIVIGDNNIDVLSEKNPEDLPWQEKGVDVVIESTGIFTEPEKARAHVKAGAKKVIVSAPWKGDAGETYVIGVNDDSLGKSSDVISNASCTTNCITPVASVIESAFGIEKAMMTTIHSYTADQRLQDAPHKDLRRARAAATNIIPTTTGATIAAGEALPALKGIFGGLSIRVPTPVVSLSDFTIITKRNVTKEEINSALVEASKQPYYQGVLGVTDEPVVSSDLIGDSHSATVDLSLTDVTAGNMVKIIAWYDNEWGYSNRLVELAVDAGKLLYKEQS